MSTLLVINDETSAWSSSSVQVIDSRWLVKGDFPLTFGMMDRWSYHPSKSLTRGDSPRGIIPCLLGLCIDDPIILPRFWLVVIHKGWIFPWLLGLCIDDPIVRPSRWLVVTRHGGYFLDFWDDRSMILSSVQVVDSWWLANEDISLTFGIMDRWYYYPSTSLTRGDSPRVDISLTFGIMDRWSYHPSKSLTRGDSPRGFPLKFWDYVCMILSSVQVVD